MPTKKSCVKEKSQKSKRLKEKVKLSQEILEIPIKMQFKLGKDKIKKEVIKRALLLKLKHRQGKYIIIPKDHILAMV